MATRGYLVRVFRAFYRSLVPAHNGDFAAPRRDLRSSTVLRDQVQLQERPDSPGEQPFPETQAGHSGCNSSGPLCRVAA